MQILTVVIGIVFVLLLLSLLATTIMELIASFFSLRGRNLIKALRNMLASSDHNEILLEDFKSNSLYLHLTEQYGRRSRADAPSYMAAETFQSILFDIILKGAPMSELESRIEALPDKDLRNVLKQLLRESGGQLDLFRLEVQNWYNNVMDRAGGWYKRYTQKILVFLGLGIAVLFNADTLSIYSRLSSNPEQLQQVVAMAEYYVQTKGELANDRQLNRMNNPSDVQIAPPVINSPAAAAPTPAEVPAAPTTDESVTNPFATDTAAAPSPVPAPTTTVAPPVPYKPAPSLPVGTPASPTDQDYARFEVKLEEFRGLLRNELDAVRSPLGLGWDGIDITNFTVYDAITKLLGFLLTAIAVSLGAPFWFDLLKKLVNVRSSGAKP